MTRWRSKCLPMITIMALHALIPAVGSPDRRAALSLPAARPAFGPSGVTKVGISRTGLPAGLPASPACLSGQPQSSKAVSARPEDVAGTLAEMTTTMAAMQEQRLAQIERDQAVRLDALQRST